MNRPGVLFSASLLPIAALLCTAAANQHHLAWWCLPLLLLATTIHLRGQLRGAPLPGRWARLGLAVLLTSAVLLSFHTLNGISAGATLLVAMTSAKLFEARQSRDWLVICGATLFLLLAACLDRQQTWRLPFYAGCLWLCAASLRGLASGGAPALTLMRESGRQLLFALPVAAILFVFFPRLPGSFWTLPGDDEAITGLSDEMSPGNIARLAESDEPALRARFTGALPPVAERYWRGPVLHDFDGFTWRRHRGPPSQGQQNLSYVGPAYRYSMSLEPNSHGTVVALELTRPTDVPPLFFTDDYQLIAPRPITRAQNYQFTAFTQAQIAMPLSADARLTDLGLPKSRNPRSRDLAVRLRSVAASDAAYVQSVLDFLRTGGYEYTLTPQRLGRDAIDDLLFNTHQGFCGHYASAFVDLMRAAGVPARVVTGYQGGEWNPVGHFLIVRQADAHAWAEVMLPNRGWLRVDPTSVIAPERLTRESLQFGGDLGRRRSGASHTPRWLITTLQTWAAVNAWWQDDVIGFNYAKQLSVAEWLNFGDGDWQTLAVALGVALSTWLVWVAWSMHRSVRAERPDRLARAWLAIDQHMTRHGFPRAPHEGVLSYCERLAVTRPQQAAILLPLARRYCHLRYAQPSGTAATREFARASAASRKWLV